MTQETPNNPNIFANDYVAPENQASFEASLLNNFWLNHPNSMPVLEEALGDIHRYVGVGKPKYGFVEAISDNAQANPGNLGANSYSDHGFSRLMLTMPAHYSDEQIANMSEDERLETSKSGGGNFIMGDLPTETVDMLNGIYGLIGAQTIRNDRATGEPSGTVLRLGVYQGTPVYIAEEYMSRSYYSGKPLVTVRLVGKSIGEAMAKRLNSSQFRELAAAVGGTIAAQRVVSTNDVTPENYRNVASVLDESRKVVDNVDNVTPPIIDLTTEIDLK
jgi:hypothetical protein